MEWLFAGRFDVLSAIDCAMLILAAYCHDLGMALQLLNELQKKHAFLISQAEQQQEKLHQQDLEIKALKAEVAALRSLVLGRATAASSGQ